MRVNVEQRNDEIVSVYPYTSINRLFASVLEDVKKNTVYAFKMQADKKINTPRVNNTF